MRSAAHGRLPYEVIEAPYQIFSGWDLMTMFGRGVDRATVESLIDHVLLEPERVRLKPSRPSAPVADAVIARWARDLPTASAQTPGRCPSADGAGPPGWVLDGA